VTHDLLGVDAAMRKAAESAGIALFR